MKKLSVLQSAAALQIPYLCHLPRALSDGDSTQFLEANKFPHKEGHAADPALSAVREGDLSERLHQQDNRGAGVLSLQGPR